MFDYPWTTSTTPSQEFGATLAKHALDIAFVLQLFVYIAEHVRQHGVSLGSLQSQYASICTARLPTSAPVEIPANATMEQLGHIDQMTQHHIEQRENVIRGEAEAYRCVRIRIGSLASAPLDCFFASVTSETFSAYHRTP
ncbi:hypothetical protein H257_16915 [Aphanomyces astaci]|uniref:Uncharacterized protein n=1 Tax=Aphanomyces astaci TaxID=112090 RepID=W4FGX9_APHAT|nr:hypothetical protein H257_16915 [Aphanomyces astaci]ETV66705.1 hypothetical protein H257_16915 [Aphanomyces astaci]|eukprot:XP_009843830.1 hypothetical protein H257_16915 [Aphanomyces astaci]